MRCFFLSCLTYKSGLFASRTLKWWQKSRDKWPASNVENFIYFERWASVDIRQYVPSRTTIVWMQSVYVGLYVVCVCERKALSFWMETNRTERSSSKRTNNRGKMFAFELAHTHTHKHGSKIELAFFSLCRRLLLNPTCLRHINSARCEHYSADCLQL